MSVKLFVERSKKSIDTIRLGWDRAARLDGIFGKRRFPIFEVWDADYDVSKNGFTPAIYPQFIRGEKTRRLFRLSYPSFFQSNKFFPSRQLYRVYEDDGSRASRRHGFRKHGGKVCARAEREGRGIKVKVSG